jgi:hypothetical protein
MIARDGKMNNINEIKEFRNRVGREPNSPLFIREAHHEPEDDDLGLPESPISSNYSKYLWTSHKRRSGTERRIRVLSPQITGK